MSQPSLEDAPKMQRLCSQMRFYALSLPRTAVHIPSLLRSGQLPPSPGHWVWEMGGPWLLDLQDSSWSGWKGGLAARSPGLKRSSLVPTHILGVNLQVSCTPYPLAGTSQKPQHHRCQRPQHLQSPSTGLAKERTGGGGAASTSPLPASLTEPPSAWG